ncbi:O-antigen ligase family protein [Halomonas sp. DP1Y21-3]|uniref:O-antigen ligase family protein n=1 Tax=Halomonas sp. DP1Y21-3 TaxID=2859080 RepID=UPI001C958C7C|nr:O-antigen ligase family protein [Halomonas sp. DP1Y21-3]MBY6112785.1 O-antigen ligase family protein [Halomonas sp. DP1Y21-3]
MFLVLSFVYSSLRICLPDIGQKSGTAIALVALFVILWTRSSLRTSTIFSCLLGVVFVQLVSWMAGYFHHPDWLPDNPELDRLGKWFLFVGVAFWLGGMRRNAEALLLFALLGFLAACFLFQGAPDEWLRGLKGQRVDLGIRNAQHTSMFFGVAVLGLLCFSRRFFLTGNRPWVMGPIWIIFFCICLLGVLVSQTRAVWLSLVVTLLLSIAVFLIAVFTGRVSRSLKRQGVIVLLCVLVVSGTGGVAFKDTLGQRLAAENSEIENAWHGKWEEIPYSSIGNRLHTWRAGLEWFSERPIVGWGGEGRGLVIDHTDWLPQSVKDQYGHLHNTLLDFVVSYGLLGLSVIIVLVIWTGLGSWKAWRAGVMPPEVFAFGWTFFVYYFIVSLFESYSFFWTGSYIQNVVMGVVVTFIWRWQLETGRSVFSFRKRLTS